MLHLKELMVKYMMLFFALTELSENIHIQTYPGNIFAVMQESGVVDMRIHRFMYDKLDQYDRVFSSYCKQVKIPFRIFHIWNGI